MDGNGPLARGLAVLRALAEHPGPALRRPDLVRLTGLARSPVDRIVATLLHLDLLRADGPDLRLSPRLHTLGHAYLHGTGFISPLRPLLSELSERLDESVSLAVPDRGGVRLVAQSARRRAVYLAFHVGGLLPADRTAAGAVLAANWDEEQFEQWAAARAADPLDHGYPAVPPLPAVPVRRAREFRRRAGQALDQGWSLDEEWVEPGLLALAAPVRGRGQLGAVSVLSHTSRHTAESFEAEVLPVLLAAVAEMEEVLARPEPGSADAAAVAAAGGGVAARGCEGAVADCVPGAVGTDAAADCVPGVVGTGAAARAELGLESLARGLAVLGAFRPGGLTVAAAARAAGLTRATAQRALRTLHATGYASQDRGVFTLLPSVLDLGYARLSALTLPEVLRPHLAELAARTGEPVAAVALDGADLHCVAVAGTGRVVRLDLAAGARRAAADSALGRALLSDPEWTEVDADSPEGPRCLAVPVRGVTPLALTVLATGSVAEREVFAQLRAGALRVEADLGVIGGF